MHTISSLTLLSGEIQSTTSWVEVPCAVLSDPGNRLTCLLPLYGVWVYFVCAKVVTGAVCVLDRHCRL